VEQESFLVFVRD